MGVCLQYKKTLSKLSWCTKRKRRKFAGVPPHHKEFRVRHPSQEGGHDEGQETRSPGLRGCWWCLRGCWWHIRRHFSDVKLAGIWSWEGSFSLGHQGEGFIDDFCVFSWDWISGAVTGTGLELRN